MEYAAKRVTDSFYRINRMVRANWGLEFKKIYTAVGESTLLYGAAAWAHRIELSTYAAIINSAQRTMLIIVCRSYRTVSTDSLPVLAGTMPADLKTQMKQEIFRDTRNGGNNRERIKNTYLEK